MQFRHFHQLKELLPTPGNEKKVLNMVYCDVNIDPYCNRMHNILPQCQNPVNWKLSWTGNRNTRHWALPTMIEYLKTSEDSFRHLPWNYLLSRNFSDWFSVYYSTSKLSIYHRDLCYTLGTFKHWNCESLNKLWSFTFLPH